MSGQDVEALVGAFDMFKKMRGELSDLLKAVLHAYQGLDQVVKNAEGTSLEISELLLSKDDQSKITKTFQDPKLVFVGQTNAGKSSLINEILGATVVKADDVPCTARIVELAYGANEKPIVEIRDKNNKVIETKEMKRAFIPSGVANLSEEDRTKSELIGSKVYAKINIPFLKSGVKIVDSPGKNEYRELDELVDEHMESVLPLIVYVIDGRSMLSKQDIDDIQALYTSVPEGNIFFVVTKCDDPDLMEDDSDVDSDDEDENTEKDPTQPSDIETEMRTGIYKKLVKHKFLENIPIDHCKNYHTLSSRYVKKYRWALKEKSQSDKTKKTVRDCQRFMDNFQRFKTCLLNFTTEQLIQTVMNSSRLLRLSLIQCLDYFMDYSNKVFKEKEENEKNIKLIEAEEFLLSQLVQELVKQARSDFVDAVRLFVSEKRETIIKFSKEFKFVRYEVPPDGFIRTSSVQEYKSELQREILEKIGGLIHLEIVSKCSQIDEIFANVSEKVKQIQEKIENKIDIHDALSEMFISQYKFDIKNAKLKRSIWGDIKNILKKILRTISFQWVAEKVKGVNIRDAKWKEGVALEILEVINPENVADVIVDGIRQHMSAGHLNFRKKLEDLRKLYDNSNRLADKDRKLIIKMAPVIARLLLTSWNITDRLHFGKIHYGKMRGKGAQGIVVDCDAKGPKADPCVAKLIRLESDAEMGDMGMEIHFSRKLSHTNIAEIYGTIYEVTSGNVYELAIILPRMERDLLIALPNIKSLQTRLNIALEVAEAILYIHQKGMMHRDIKCANVLLDDKNHVKITDFGLCKPPGISNVSFVGTPVHMAPEIIQQLPYSEKVDVYAFGILLWYICEGKGNHPKYVFQHNAVQGLLVETAIGRRPERLPSFRDDCWELMEKCWAGEPIVRPNMDVVIADLKTIIRGL